MTRSSSSTRGGTKGGGGAMGGFVAGVFLIAFALPMVWMNERREVH